MRTKIRGKLKGPPGTESFFIVVARERLSKPVYDSIMTEASNRARDAAKARGE